MSYTKQEIEEMELYEVCDVCKEYGLIRNYYFFDDFSEWLTNDGFADADDILRYARYWDTNNYGYEPSNYDVIIIDEDYDPIGYDKSDLYDKLISYLEENDLLDENGSDGDKEIVSDGDKEIVSDGDKEIVINVSEAQNLI